MYYQAFLSTLSLRRATAGVGLGHKLSIISIHALLAESDRVEHAAVQEFLRISIHALLAESDVQGQARRAKPGAISIHALLAESDGQKRRLPVVSLRFLSTLSLRRATAMSTTTVMPTTDFYPRSPCGERLRRLRKHYNNPRISIHALLAESDRSSSWPSCRTSSFLSTLSLRRATHQLRVLF